MTDQRSGDAFRVSRLRQAMTPPDGELRGKLERFVHLTRGLVQSPLFKSPNIGLRCMPRGDGLFEVECLSPVDDFGVRGLLTYFRQLWQKGEYAQFGALRGLLRQHVEPSGLPASAEFVDWLDDLGRADRHARRAYPDFTVLEAEIGPSEVLRDEAVRAERILEDWVNGEIFHSDPEKNARIDWAGDPDAYRFALLTAVQEMTKVYVLFAQMANAICEEPAFKPSDG